MQVILLRELIQLVDQENQGKGACRNKGLQAAQGNLIVILDADNEIAMHYFKEAVWMLERTQV